MIFHLMNGDGGADFLDRMPDHGRLKLQTPMARQPFLLQFGDGVERGAYVHLR